MTALARCVTRTWPYARYGCALIGTALALPAALPDAHIIVVALLEALRTGIAHWLVRLTVTCAELRLGYNSAEMRRDHTVRMSAKLNAALCSAAHEFSATSTASVH